MTTSAVPSTSPEGFVPLARLARFAADRSLASFAATYPEPALRVVAIGPVGRAGQSGGVGESNRQLLTLSKTGDSAFRYYDEVAFLRKRPGNPFPQFISVGRARNNDIVLGVDGVSKNHGYFTNKEGRWLVADSRSTNGMQLNGEPIEAGQQYPVANGDRIRWGDELVTEFLTPQALYECARSRR